MSRNWARGGARRSLLAAIIVTIVAGGVDTAWAQACPTRVYLYAAVWSPPQIRTYCIGTNGALTFLRLLTGPGDGKDIEVVRNAAGGRDLYYASSNVTKYSIAAATGDLTEVATTLVGNGSFDDLVADPLGTSLYGTHSSGRLFAWDIRGAQPAQIQVVSGLIVPQGVALHPLGRWVYVANQFSIQGALPGTQEVAIFDRATDGSVNPVPRYTTWGVKPRYFAINPTGDFLYASQSPGSAVTVGVINATGSTAPGSAPVRDTRAAGPSTLVVDGANRNVYVANTNSNNVSVFALDRVSGRLTLAQLVAAGARPRHLMLHPNGQFLYVVNGGDPSTLPSIAVYSVDAMGLLTLQLTSGVLLPVGGHRLAIADLSASPVPLSDPTAEEMVPVFRGWP